MWYSKELNQILEFEIQIIEIQAIQSLWIDEILIIHLNKLWFYIGIDIQILYKLCLYIVPWEMNHRVLVHIGDIQVLLIFYFSFNRL